MQKQTQDAPVSHPADDSGNAEKTTKKKKRTIGNIIYDFGVFGSIAWLGNSFFSVLAGYGAQHGFGVKLGDETRAGEHWSSKGLHKVSKKAESGIKNQLERSNLAQTHLSEGTRNYLAEGSALYATLAIGSMALLAPLKWMEDKRKTNAAKIDEMLGTTPKDADAVKDEPPQTWRSVFSGRVVSLAVGYAAVVGMAFMPEKVRNLPKWFGEKTTNVIMRGDLESNPAKAEKVRAWADIGAFDAVFTVVTAGITYLSSRRVARKQQEKHQRQVHPPVAAASPSAPKTLEAMQTQASSSAVDAATAEVAHRSKPAQEEYTLAV